MSDPDTLLSRGLDGARVCAQKLCVNRSGVRFITQSGDIAGRAGEGALRLVFARGCRPDAVAVRTAVAQHARLAVTHALGPRVGQQPTALELLCMGMTFDLTGLAPGDGAQPGSVRHRFAIDAALDVSDCEAIALAPGPHIAAGARTIPVMRTLAGLAVDLSSSLPDLVGVAWPPAGTLVGRDFFASTVRSWIDGGAFPALGLTAFAVDDAGRLRSDGLAWFTRQEIVLDRNLSEDRAAATRLGIRLVNQLAGRGRLDASELVVGPDSERLALEPRDDMIEVRRA